VASTIGRFVGHVIDDDMPLSALVIAFIANNEVSAIGDLHKMESLFDDKVTSEQSSVQNFGRVSSSSRCVASASDSGWERST
jgi:hypothetical protein